jgi:hypothetical protein
MRKLVLLRLGGTGIDYDVSIVARCARLRLISQRRIIKKQSIVDVAQG